MAGQVQFAFAEWRNYHTVNQIVLSIVAHIVSHNVCCFKHIGSLSDTWYTIWLLGFVFIESAANIYTKIFCSTSKRVLLAYVVNKMRRATHWHHGAGVSPAVLLGALQKARQKVFKMSPGPQAKRRVLVLGPQVWSWSNVTTAVAVKVVHVIIVVVKWRGCISSCTWEPGGSEYPAPSKWTIDELG